jgi:DNA-binding protein Fis
MKVNKKKYVENTVWELVDSLLGNKNNHGVWPEVERLLIKWALEKTGGNQVRASNLLGISRNTLRKRMEKYKIAKKIKIVEKGE